MIESETEKQMHAFLSDFHFFLLVFLLPFSYFMIIVRSFYANLCREIGVGKIFKLGAFSTPFICLGRFFCCFLDLYKALRE